jgi:predicted O-methyltransferase YrrM
MDTEESEKYVRTIYVKKDLPSAKEYLEKIEYKGSMPIVEDDIARLFQVLLQLTRPKRILEIGMNVGFSTTVLALIAKEFDGTVTTIEYNDNVVMPARIAFKREGVDDRIEILIGDAKEILPSLESESFDMVFQDSDKCLYGPLLDDCIRILRKGGLLLFDDSLFPLVHEREGWKRADDICIDKFNKKIATRKDIVSTILPLGEGITIAIKR